MNAFRERDIRRAIEAALMATGQFDEADESIDEAEQVSACQVEAFKGIAFAEDNDGPIVDSRVKLRLLVRHADEEQRDDRAELLLNLACNVLNKNGFGGLAAPDWSMVSEWTWLEADPPEREIEAIFRFRYLVDSWQGFNTTE